MSAKEPNMYFVHKPSKCTMTLRYLKHSVPCTDPGKELTQTLHGLPLSLYAICWAYIAF